MIISHTCKKKYYTMSRVQWELPEEKLLDLLSLCHPYDKQMKTISEEQ